jgi:repressor LexA
MKELTVRQKQILELIYKKIESTGLPPTRAEISEEFGFKSPNAAEEHLRALAKKGAIEMLSGTSRGIRVPASTAQKGVPIVGNLSAGVTVLSEESIEGFCTIEPSTFYPKMDYFLRVKGSSMKEAGILEGDLLAVHRTQNVGNGQVAIVRVGDDLIVKRFKKEQNKIYLMAENTTDHSMVLDIYEDKFSIEGIGVGVVRAQGL